MDELEIVESEPVETFDLKKSHTILLSHSEAENFDDAIQEWTFVAAKGPGTCECGHKTNTLFEINNSTTDKSLFFGKDCIDSFGDDLLTDSCVIATKETKGSDRRLCGSCLNLRISGTEKEYVVRCASCFQKGNEIKQAYKNSHYKECKECHENEIPPGSPEWKTTCSACYGIKKDLSRECQKCGLKRISPKESANTKICFPCKKEMGMKKCEGCGLENIYAAEKWRKICIDCWKKSK